MSRVLICQVWECFIDHWVVFGLFLKKKGLYLGLYVNYDSFCCCCCCAINDFLILLWRQICMITCVRSRSNAILLSIALSAITLFFSHKTFLQFYLLIFLFISWDLKAITEDAIPWFQCSLSLFKESKDYVLCRSKQPRHHRHIAKISWMLPTKSGFKNHHATPSQLPPRQQSVIYVMYEPRSRSPLKSNWLTKILKT